MYVYALFTLMYVRGDVLCWHHKLVEHFFFFLFIPLLNVTFYIVYMLISTNSFNNLRAKRL